MEGPDWSQGERRESKEELVFLIHFSKACLMVPEPEAVWERETDAVPDLVVELVPVVEPEVDYPVITDT